jgi:hypothetical protein
MHSNLAYLFYIPRSSVELEVELRQATKSRSIFDKQVATLRSK